MLKAETRSLILGSVLAPSQDYPRGPQQPCDPTRMADRELELNYYALLEHAQNITRQLDDDKDLQCSRGDIWRRRAMGARRFRLAEADRILLEARKRRLAWVTETAPPAPLGLNGQPLPPPDPTIYARQQARERQAAIEAEIRARKAAEAAQKAEQTALRIEAEQHAARAKAEQHAAFLQAQADRRAAAEARARNQERLFVEAARDLLGNDACREIWQHARQRHPDPAIWSHDQVDA